MSVIIGYKNEGKVYIATDTRRGYRNYNYSSMTESALNVFSLPNNILCGVSKLNNKLHIQAVCEKWFEPLGNDMLTKRFIVENIVPKLYALMESHNLIENSKNGYSNFKASIILAQNDKLFCIDSDFSVFEIPKFCIIGDAAEGAYARIVTYKGEIPVSEMLRLAIADAQYFYQTVKKPYLLFTTDSKEMQILEDN